MDRFILFVLLAAAEAIAQAGWQPADAHEAERTATIIASGIGGFPAMVETVQKNWMALGGARPNVC